MLMTQLAAQDTTSAVLLDRLADYALSDAPDLLSSIAGNSNITARTIMKITSRFGDGSVPLDVERGVRQQLRRLIGEDTKPSRREQVTCHDRPAPERVDRVATRDWILAVPRDDLLVRWAGTDQQRWLDVLYFHPHVSPSLATAALQCSCAPVAVRVSLLEHLPMTVRTAAAAAAVTAPDKRSTSLDREVLQAIDITTLERLAPNFERLSVRELRALTERDDLTPALLQAIHRALEPTSDIDPYTWATWCFNLATHPGAGPLERARASTALARIDWPALPAAEVTAAINALTSLPPAAAGGELPVRLLHEHARLLPLPAVQKALSAFTQTIPLLTTAQVRVLAALEGRFTGTLTQLVATVTEIAT